MDETLDRRRFLKGVGTTAVGASGIATLSGTAAANEWEGGDVSTRGHYDCDVNPQVNEEYYYTSNVPCFDKGCVGDLTVAVHGWNNSHSDALGMFDEAGSELAGENYGGEVIGWSWDSDCDSWNNWHDFNVAKDIAWKNGIKLANFIIDYKNANPNGSLRLLGHSLGARLVLSGLHHQRYYYSDYSERVTSAHTVGAAVPGEWPNDSNFYYPIRYNTTAFYNYHNEDDGTLKWYQRKAATDGALGTLGAIDGSPCNYHDRDVTTWWGDQHGFDYYMSYCAPTLHQDMADAAYDSC